MGVAVAAKFDYYTELKVSRTATAEEIKKSYRDLVRRWHPDLATPANRDVCEEKTKRLNVAYDTLCDPTKRSRYDRETYAPARPTHAQPVYTHVVYNTRRVWNPYTGSYREVRYNEQYMTQQQHRDYLRKQELLRQELKEMQWRLGTETRHFTIVIPPTTDEDWLCGNLDRGFAKVDARTYEVKRSTQARKKFLWWETRPEMKVIEFDVRGKFHLFSIFGEVFSDMLKQVNGTLTISR